MAPDPLMPELLAQLVGTRLVAVTFVRGYLHFQFEGPSGHWTLSAFTLPSVSSRGVAHEPGSPTYRDAIVDRSDHGVIQTAASPEQLEIAFDDGARFLISLRLEDLVGTSPESAMLSGEPSGRWGVWRPSDIQ